MNRKGFSLLEMLTTILIIGILSAIALPQYARVREKAHFSRAQVMARALYASCERLLTEFGVDYNALDANDKKIPRLDIGSVNLLPGGFSISQDEMSISGAGFSYALKQDEPECVVQITKISDNTQIVYNGESFTCSDTGTGTCDLFGLED